ncbi:MAG TPA: shikimate dehydrogenase [Streptosporangiaceae bacterium]|nr:shikimate dehydrogenase [Streptosporangiaceae bacterium]
MKAAVLGSPVAHSLSPALHLAAYRSLGLDGWSYQAIECDEARLPALLAEYGAPGAGWAGLSLTMPLKQAVLGLLDRIDPLAEHVGAANTVVFTAGLRRGYNTDVPGMLAALAEAGLTASGPEPALGPVLILGGGATARSALAAVRGLGVTEVAVAVRDEGRAAGLLAAARRLGIAVRLVPFGAPGPAQAEPALLISTVPARAADFHAQRIQQRALSPKCVLDVVYDPWPTALAAAAGKAGAVVAGGFDLLLHQAAAQVELMTGKRPPIEQMRAAGLAAIQDRR